MTDATISLLVSAAVSVVGSGFGAGLMNWFREGRLHRWAEREQEQLKAEREATAIALKAQVHEENVQVALKIAAQHTELLGQVKQEAAFGRQRQYELKDAVEQNTALTVKAHDAAIAAQSEVNHLNARLLMIKTEPVGLDQTRNG